MRKSEVATFVVRRLQPFCRKVATKAIKKVATETALNMPLSLAEIRLFFDFLNEQYSFMSVYKN